MKKKSPWLMRTPRGMIRLKITGDAQQISTL